MRMNTDRRRFSAEARLGPDDGGPGDDDLLCAAGAGDRAAFKMLMDRHVRPMLALATRVTRSADDADEIVQEAFLKVWVMAPKWQPDGDARFGTWLYRVVLNACLDRGRRAPFAPLDDAGDPADSRPGGLESAMESQRNTVLAQALADMPSRQGQALTLYYFSELSGPQAARVLDLSLSALEALLVRGKRNLKAMLAKRGITSLGDLT
jgi:RNA polymerase sigma-70 factor (ECF subfamily)